METTPVPILEFKNVSVRHNSRNIFSNVSFAINQSEKVILTGATGSGKSTLLLTLLGRYSVSTGSIIVNGQELTPQTAQSVRQRIAYIQQEPVFESDIVRNCLHMPFQFKSNRGLSVSGQEWNQYLDDFQLSSAYMSKPVSTLSGGEKQKIACIQALSLKRPLLLADEPTSAQDKKGSQIIAQKLIDASSAVIAVSHDSIFTGQFKRILTLKNGLMAKAPEY